MDKLDEMRAMLDADEDRIDDLDHDPFSWSMDDAIYDGDRIAQLLFNVPVELVQVDELTPTERGNGGFGSTGRTDLPETAAGPVPEGEE